MGVGSETVNLSEYLASAVSQSWDEVQLLGVGGGTCELALWNWSSHHLISVPNADCIPGSPEFLLNEADDWALLK